MKTVNIPDDLHDELKRLALDMKLRLRDLVTRHLRDAVKIYQAAQGKRTPGFCDPVYEEIAQGRDKP